MRKNSVILKSLIILCMSIVFMNASTNTTNTLFEEIDAYIQRQMDHLHIPSASLAIVDNNKIVHMRGFGSASIKGEIPTPQTPFFIGSLTKSVTALAVMQLVEAGKIDLDAPAMEYLPWFQANNSKDFNQITVRHLLNQTSGFSESSGRIYLADFDQSDDATERQTRSLLDLAQTHPVGSKFEYTNLNYNILGLIIESVSGELYEDYVQHNIFNPLDMKRSTSSKAIAQQNDPATGHRYWFTIPIAKDMQIPKGSLPSGQLISSSEDMAHFLIAHLNEGYYGNKRILKPENIDEIFYGVAESIQMGMSFGKYGMGWFIDKIGQTEIAWHTGIVPNYFSYMAILPEQNTGVILLFNAYGYLMTPALSETGEGVASLIAGKQPVPDQSGYMTWIQRGLLLIPLLQVIGVIFTLRRLKRQRIDPENRPSTKRIWGLHLLLPLIPNFLIACTLIPVLGATRGFWMLYMPDFSWIAIICGSFAGIWIFLRSFLILCQIKSS